MISEIKSQNPELLAAIHALGREAYAVEARLIGCADFPPLPGTVGQLGASRDRFLVFEIRTDSGTGETPVPRHSPEGIAPAHFRKAIEKRAERR